MMKGAWGSKWTIHIEDSLEVTLALWEHAIRDLSDDQIAQTLKYCIAILDYPPSISQFRKTALGVTSAEEAFCRKNVNSIAKQAFDSMDGFVKRNGTEKEVKEAFAISYKQIVEKLLIGGD
jgi:hypothetical protein